MLFNSQDLELVILKAQYMEEDGGKKQQGEHSNQNQNKKSGLNKGKYQEKNKEK